MFNVCHNCLIFVPLLKWMCTTFVLIFVEYIGVLVGYLCPCCEYLTMNDGLCLMFVLAAALCKCAQACSDICTCNQWIGYDIWVRNCAFILNI